MQNKYSHLLYVPFCGLGLYNGFRGNRWLKSRIQIFKQFVVANLMKQSDRDFILWISWRQEEKNNKQVKELKEWLYKNTNLVVLFTYSGVCFYDDKYLDEVARDRLITALHGASGELSNIIGECEYVLMTIQPSDDIYHLRAIEGIKKSFDEDRKIQALGFSKGYICDYKTMIVKNYDPDTNPPFYTIKFPRETFLNPLKHVEYTALKKDIDPYKKGTPLPSHEYVKDCLYYGRVDQRGFLVGTHLDNISTVFDHPYAKESVDKEILKDFGIYDVEPLKVKLTLGRILLRKLPYSVRRKLRWHAERKWLLRPVFGLIYAFLRS